MSGLENPGSGARLTVDIADMKIATTPGDVLVTYALGSCLGIAIHDPVTSVGGLLHVMLPLSTIDPSKAKANPDMFVDTSVPKLFLACYQAGAKKERLVVKVAGGACTGRGDREDHFQIGHRNMLILRKVLWKSGVLLSAAEVGGTIARTMSLEVGSGNVTLRSGGRQWLI